MGDAFPFPGQHDTGHRLLAYGEASLGLDDGPCGLLWGLAGGSYPEVALGGQLGGAQLGSLAQSSFGVGLQAPGNAPRQVSAVATGSGFAEDLFVSITELGDGAFGQLFNFSQN
jgi:hypothetical protein